MLKINGYVHIWYKNMGKRKFYPITFNFIWKVNGKQHRIFCIIVFRKTLYLFNFDCIEIDNEYDNIKSFSRDFIFLFKIFIVYLMFEMLTCSINLKPYKKLLFIPKKHTLKQKKV